MPRSRPDGQPAWLKPGRAGGAVLRTRNPYGNPCPACGALRYERCFTETGIDAPRFSLDDIANGAGASGKFIYIKDEPCARRVDLVLGIDTGFDNEQEGDDE